MERASSGVSLPCSSIVFRTSRAAILQLAQVAEPLLELAQLRVVEAARLLLAVAGDERDRRALAKQLHRRRHLARGNAQLLRDALVDLVHAALLCQPLFIVSMAPRHTPSRAPGNGPNQRALEICFWPTLAAQRSTRLAKDANGRPFLTEHACMDPKTLATETIVPNEQANGGAGIADDELVRQIRRRRTFAIISHPDAGKTTLTEKLLLFGGAIQLAGQVKAKKDKRSTRSDWMAIERARGISVATSVMTFEYEDAVLNLLDTPGHEDFSDHTYRTLTAVDSAIMVIDAAKGIEARTRKLFEVCRLRDIPIITFINKMDRESREPLELLDEIEKVLALDTAPMVWPIGKGKEFRGTYDFLQPRVRRLEGNPDGLPVSGPDDPVFEQLIEAGQVAALARRAPSRARRLRALRYEGLSRRDACRPFTSAARSRISACAISSMRWCLLRRRRSIARPRRGPWWPPSRR